MCFWIPNFRLVLQLRYTIYVQSHGGMSVCNTMLKIRHCLIMLCVLISCIFILACRRFHGSLQRMFGLFCFLFFFRLNDMLLQKSFLLKKPYFIFSWLTRFIRDEWVAFDSQTTVWPNVSAVIATTIRVCDFIKLVCSNVQVCVGGPKVKSL